ncbi:MAG: ATP-binding protein [Bacteroidales bacterium]
MSKADEKSAAASLDPDGGGGQAVERLMAEMREANEHLVVSTIDAQASTEAAERENQFKEDFLATLSHELRTPLHAIFGWARMLEDGRLDVSQSGRAVDAIGRNARAMVRIVDELLDVTRISAGKMLMAKEWLDVSAVIRASVDALVPTAAAQGVDLYYSSRLAGERVHADPGRLQQVLWNLVTNAIKFTPASGRVHVHLAIVDAQVEIRVTDTGEGIAPALLPLVFERFRQGHKRAAGVPQGLGLGLAIARDLVALHGGSLRAESEGPGCGATFTVLLPVVAAADRGDAAKPSGRAQRRALEGITVLLVEHDADARELAATILESDGATVTTASSARDARSALATARPDVLVSAIGLPDQDGRGLLADLRADKDANGWRLAAVALTAYSRADDLAEILEAGFDAHLLKPVEPRALTSAVLGALSSHA